MRSTPFGAAYTADRAAGLAGIPRSTLHYWSRQGIWVPSVSATKVKRWSYSDLLGLRLIDWLRKEKSGVESDLQIPKTSMARIRIALEAVESLGERLVESSVRVSVDPRGGIVIGAGGGVFVPLRGRLLQGMMNAEIDLLAAFDGSAGLNAPNLATPRSTIRIIPGKLSGEPHVVDTRTPTSVVAGMAGRGFESAQIVELYPALTEQNVAEAIDLEEQLQAALRTAA